VIDGGTGASTLWTGAVDDALWTAARDPAAPPPAAPVRDAIDALGAIELGDRNATVLTLAGLARPARGRDASILDVGAPESAGAVAVVRCHRPGWSADALARAWGERFTAVDGDIVRFSDEELLPDADFAGRHDDDARLGWLAERLREVLARNGTSFSAIALPPSLGVDRARAAWLSRRVGVPCGEAVGLPGGPAGLRFENARDRAFAALGARRVLSRATRIEAGGAALRVIVDGGGCIEARAVVLSTGGLIGGGIEYTPSEAALATALPPTARVPLRLNLDAPVSLGAAGRPLEVPGSLFGPAPESIAAPFVRDALLDRAGVLVADDGAALATSSAPASASTGLYAAGEIVADAPHTWLRAFAGGVRAGSSAARHALTATDGELARSLDVAPASPP
jgi:hypothetical protein